MYKRCVWITNVLITNLRCGGTWPSFHGTGQGAGLGRSSAPPPHGGSKPNPQSPAPPAGPWRQPGGPAPRQSPHSRMSSGLSSECTVKHTCYKVYNLTKTCHCYCLEIEILCHQKIEIKFTYKQMTKSTL